MQLGDVVELLRSASSLSPSLLMKLRDVPELAEVAAALVGRVLAPQQLARELVVEPDHVGLDEALVGLDQRDAVRARSG